MRSTSRACVACKRAIAVAAGMTELTRDVVRAGICDPEDLSADRQAGGAAPQPSPRCGAVVAVEVGVTPDDFVVSPASMSVTALEKGTP